VEIDQEKVLWGQEQDLYDVTIHRVEQWHRIRDGLQVHVDIELRVHYVHVRIRHANPIHYHCRIVPRHLHCRGDSAVLVLQTTSEVRWEAVEGSFVNDVVGTSPVLGLWVLDGQFQAAAVKLVPDANYFNQQLVLVSAHCHRCLLFEWLGRSRSNNANDARLRARSHSIWRKPAGVTSWNSVRWRRKMPRGPSRPWKLLLTRRHPPNQRLSENKGIGRQWQRQRQERRKDKVYKIWL